MVVVVAGAVAGVPAVASEAEAEIGCADHFPFLSWNAIGSVGPIDVRTVAVDPQLSGRILDDVGDVVGLLDGELSLADDLHVCVFGADASINDAGLLPPGQRVHAVVFGPDQVVAVDAQQLVLVEPAITYGIAYAALWATAAELGTVGYPEPLGTAVAQWYMARVGRRLEAHHASIRTATFFADPEGRAESADWAMTMQEPVFVWNPEFIESPIGDLVEFAVARNGPAILRTPTSDVWAAVDADWRVALRDELLQGATGERAWRVGLGLVIGLIVVAVLLAFGHRRVKRRHRYQVGKTEPIPGFFDDGGKRS